MGRGVFAVVSGGAGARAPTSSSRNSVAGSGRARPLRRALQKYVEDPLSEAFIRGTVKPGQPVTIFADGDKLGLRQTDAVEEPLSV